MSDPGKLTSVFGQGEELAMLLRQARSLRMHHGVVVAGVAGAGKSLVALHLAAALLCLDAGAVDAACGKCRACRKVAHDNHPDLHLLTVPEEKYDIPVDDVRDLRAVLERLPVEGRARVMIIDPADRLNEQGQNALLKTLEEPGRDTFLILVTARPEGLLETVRSRSIRLQVRPLPKEKILAELDRGEIGDDSHRERAAELARGSLGRAVELCTEHAVQLQDLVVQVCGDGKRLRPVSISRAVLEGSKGRRDAIARARLFLYLLRSWARQRELSHLESQSTGAYASGVIDSWNSRFEPLLSAETDLDLQVPPEQVLTGLLLQWRDC